MKKTCYAQSSQIRNIRKKMVEIMIREASACDLKELVGKFIPESIGTALPPPLTYPWSVPLFSTETASLLFQVGGRDLMFDSSI